MVKKYETTKSVTGGLPRVPIPIPTTAAPNQISEAIASDRETRHEMARQSQRQVRLQEQDDGGQLG